jgi:hypothetical protein
MKIYADSRPISLDRFIGQDVWVLCERSVSRYMPTVKAFIRVLDKTSDGYIINHFSQSFFDLDGTFSYAQITAELNERMEVYSNIYKVVTPIEIYTTDEIFEECGCEYKLDTTKFDSYIGKDIWVKVHKIQQAKVHSYIKILSKLNANITFNLIPQVYFHYAGKGEDWDSFNYCVDKVRVENMDQFVIDKPLETFTTEELSDWFGREMEKNERK